MAETISGKLDASPHRFAIVAARFNEFFTRKLLDAAVDVLVRHGAQPEHITQVWVPGSFEIPLAARKLAESGRCDAVICIGCLLRGQTLHFDLIAAECARGIAQAALATGVPVTFGVVTADTLEQAVDRCGAKAGNKGAEAALAAIEMANLLATLAR